MSEPKLYQTFFNLSLSGINKGRAKVICAAVTALTQDCRATLSSIARHLGGNASVKNSIKKIDRLLGNAHLYQELSLIYGQLIRQLTKNLTECIIVVDWSPYPNRAVHQLRASLIYEGRALPLVSLLVAEKEIGNEHVHRNCLLLLSKYIDANKRVTIVTDAGFRSSWFKQVSGFGWYYVARLRNNVQIKFDGSSEWENIESQSSKAESTPKYLGSGVLGKAAKAPCWGYFHIYKGKSKRRKSGKTNRLIHAVKDIKRVKKGAKEPWLLMTNREDLSAKQMVSLYRCRMQIEQNFRDEKSPQYGFSLRYSRSKCIKRLSVLCMLTVLATVLLWLLGYYLERKNRHLAFQANSIKNRRVLSFLTLAKGFIKKKRMKGLPSISTERIIQLFSRHYIAVVYQEYS